MRCSTDKVVLIDSSVCRRQVIQLKKLGDFEFGGLQFSNDDIFTCYILSTLAGVVCRNTRGVRKISENARSGTPI